MVTRIFRAVSCALLCAAPTAAQIDSDSPRPMIRQVWAGDIPGVWAVSPSGSVIAYSDDQFELALYDVAGGTRRAVHSGPREAGDAMSIAWSPDGKEIAYAWITDSGVQIRVSRADGGQRRASVNLPSEDPVTLLGWSSDRAHLVARFVREVASPPGELFEFTLLSLTDGQARHLTTVPNFWRTGRQGIACLSPDGREIAIGRLPTPTSRSRDVYLISAVDGHVRPLIQHAADDFPLGWVANGPKLIFASDRTGTTDAWSIAVHDGMDSDPPERVRRDVGVVYPNGATEDGSLFYTVKFGMASVYRIALDPKTGQPNGQPSQVLERFVGHNSGPDWSPDGQDLIVQVGFPGTVEGNELLVQNLENRSERIVEPALAFFSRPRYAADGQSVVVQGFGYDNVFSLYSVDLQTGASKLVLPDGANPAWAKNGRLLFYEGDGASVWVLDKETGQSTKIHSEDRRSGFNSAPSRDGEYVALVNGNTLSMIAVSNRVKRTILELSNPDRFQRFPGALSWAADGRWVLFGARIGGRNGLWRIAAEGGALEALEITARPNEDIWFLRTSADGRSLAFVMGDILSRPLEIWAMHNFLLP